MDGEEKGARHNGRYCQKKSQVRQYIYWWLSGEELDEVRDIKGGGDALKDGDEARETE